MTNRLPTLTNKEIRRCVPPDDETGFGALTTPKGVLPLKGLDVRTRIDGLVAQTTVSQTFVNALDEPLEATYIFPLPDRAAVTAFRMEVAGRVVEGVLKERGEARRTYDEAIQAGRRAAITEEERPGVFTLRVGNLMPGETAAVRLTLSGPLEYSEGEATYRFPLVVAPRYIPGVPLPGPCVGDCVAPDTDSVPDASRITPPVLLPGFPNPVQLALTVEVRDGGLPVRDLRSSLHAVVTDEGQGYRRVSLQPGERLNRDFILRFRVADAAIRTALILQPDTDATSQEGTLLLTVVPSAGPATPRPRDVVFVLDRSGSMDGWKIVAARRALARMVDTLTDADHFAVYAFDDAVEKVPEFGGTGLVPATNRNRFRAVEFLAGLEARGGTEMARPLDQAVRCLAQSDPQRERILVLVTDGQVGNEDQILLTLGLGIKEIRVFTLGIDQAVNAAFLKRLAALGGGACELVESEDRLDEVMDKVHRRIGSPVLTDLRLEPAGLEILTPSLVPARLSGLFAGTPLVIQGRYRGAARGAVKVQARDAAGRPWAETVTAQAGDNPAITALWARGFVRELEDRYVIGQGNKGALEKQIVQTSLRFGVLCRFTAFVAVDVKEVVNPGGRVHRVTQPVEPAAGWAMLGTEEPPAGPMGQVFAFCPPRAALSIPELSGRWRGIIPPVARASAPKASMKRRKQTPAPAAAPQGIEDLTAYRHRAADLLRFLQSAAGDRPEECLSVFHFLAMQLAALVEDLKSTDVPVAAWQPLAELLAALEVLITDHCPVVDGPAVALLLTRAREVLRQFSADQGAPADGNPRPEFWK